jgi:membrane-bound lytic murein transglycosylase MltF
MAKATLHGWLAALLLTLPAASALSQTDDPAPLALEHYRETLRTGDLDEMVRQRQVRALVVYSKTLYFVDRGTQRGLSYSALKEFEDYLNRRIKPKSKQLRMHVVFVPVSRDQLLPALLDGRGDIAVANLTVTPEREEIVDFSDPVYENATEIVVTSKDAPALSSAEDLSGRDVYVRKSSSYYSSLGRLNETLAAAGKPMAELRLVDEHLEDEDLLEMVNAGLIDTVVVDDHKAQFWAQIFPDIRLHPSAQLRSHGRIAWALRKDNPKFKALVNQFVRGHKAGTKFGNVLFTQYLKRTAWAKRALSERDLERFRRTVEVFHKYGDRYGFDYLMLVAQGYQESGLDQSVVSPVGAVGIMQVMPATGAQMKVGDITKLDANVHAGTKYMRLMLDEYFSDEAIDPLNRALFTCAAYNAGPGKVAQLRRDAARAGLDPNRWFNNVERMAARRIGRETVQYVSNISKYYLAYKLVAEQEERRATAIQRLRTETDDTVQAHAERSQ